MAEDIEPTPATIRERKSPFKAIEFSKEEVDLAFKLGGADATQFLSRTALNLLNDMPEFRGTADYNEVTVTGDAPILEGRGPLDDNQVLKLFTTLKDLGEDGAPTEVDAYLSGLTRGTSSAATGLATAKLFAQSAPQYFPLPGKLAPFGVLSKPVAGFGGFIAGSVLGDKYIGKPLATEIFGTLDDLDVVLSPKAEAKFRMYESAGNVTPFVFLNPQLAPKAKLSTISNIKKLPTANRQTVLTAEEYQNPLIQKYLQGKITAQPTRREFIRKRDEIFKAAKERGLNITLKDAAKQAANDLNRFGLATRGILGTVGYLEDALISGGKFYKNLDFKGKLAYTAIESTAIPATGALVGITETAFPRQEGPRLAAEIAGGIAPNLSMLRFIVPTYQGIKNYFTRLREDKALGKSDILGTRARARKRALEDIYNIFEDNSEDPDKFLKALEERLVDPVIEDGKVIAYKLKPEFEEFADAGKFPDGRPRPKAPIFTSQFVESDAIAQLEQTVLGRSGKSAIYEGARDESFEKSMEMQRGLVRALVGTGDTELVKIAGEMMQDRIAILINKRMERAVTQTVRAVEKIYPNGGPEASRILGERLAEAVKAQQELFRRLERNAWQKVKKTEQITKFTRKNEETGEFVESKVPNFIEEWENTLKGMSDLEITVMYKKVPEFKEINDFVIDQKSKLRLESPAAFKDKPNVAQFRRALDNSLVLLEGVEGTPNMRGVNLRQFFEDLVEGTMNQFVFPDGSPVIGVPRGTSLEDLRAGRVPTIQGTRIREIRKVPRSPSDQVRALRIEAENLSEADFDSRLVRAVNNQANLIAARAGLRGGITEFDDMAIGINAKDIFGFYSVAGDIARDQGTVNDKYARIANSVKQAALDDLNSLPMGRGAYDNARNLSFAYNTFLKRTFGNEILQTDARGKQIIAPHLLTSKLITGKPDVVSLRILEIQEIGEQIKNYAKQTNFDVVGETDLEGSVGTINEVLHDMLRLAVRDIELPIAGKGTISEAQKAILQDEALNQFKIKNAQVIERLPQLESLFDEVKTAGEFLKRVKKTTERLEKKVNSQKMFKKLTGADNPEKAVEAAFNSDTPMKDLKLLGELVKKSTDPRKKLRQKRLIAKQGGFNLEEARAGLKRSALDFAFNSGGRSGNKQDFNASTTYDTLFSKIPNARKDDDTLAQFLINSDVLTQKEANALELGLRRIIQAEGKKKAGDAIIQDQVPALQDFYTRVIGARAGTAVGGLIGGRGVGAGLIEAEAGSKYLRKITQEIPALQEFDALETILLDPELLALSLRQPRSPAEKKGIIRSILRKLGTFGIGIPVPATRIGIPLGAQEFNEEDFEAEPPVIQEEQRLDVRSKVEPSFSPPVNRSQQPAVFGQVTPSLNPIQNTQRVDRRRFAALFPEDADLVQGIGSLRG